MKQRSSLFYGSLILIQNILLGIGNPIAKYGLSSFPFFLYVSVRFLMGSLFLVLIFHKRISGGMRASFWKPGTLIAALTAGAYILGTLTFKYTTATSAGFLFALPVIFTPFLMRFVSKVKIDKKNTYRYSLLLQVPICSAAGAEASHLVRERLWPLQVLFSSPASLSSALSI